VATGGHGGEPADFLSDAAIRFCIVLMKGSVPPSVTMTHIYRGIIPFVVLQVLVLAACIASRNWCSGCRGRAACSISVRYSFVHGNRENRMASSWFA
jgi:hypothetical protein